MPSGHPEPLALILLNDIVWRSRRVAWTAEGRRTGFCWTNRLITNRMSTKEALWELAEKLPPDATLVDAISELEFHRTMEQGWDEGIPID